VLRDTDRAGAPPAALINETLARREFPGESPIGQRILVRKIVPGQTELGEEIAWEVVGVVASEKINGLGDEVSAGMYVSHQQSPSYGLDLVVQAGVPPQSLQRAIGSAIQSVSRGQALGDVRTLEQIVDQSLLGNRVVSTILAAFASIALLLSALGIYGVVSYTAAQRTQEMGVRAALGASAGHVRFVILWSGVRLTVAGLVIGFFGTLMTTRVLSTLLYGVGIDDTATIAVVATVLGGVAGLACFIPAWRISKVGPMDALRWRV